MDVNQVFYVKDMSTKPKRGKNNNDPIYEPKCHIFLSGKRNIVEIEDKSDISEDYEKDERFIFVPNIVEVHGCHSILL